MLFSKLLLLGDGLEVRGRINYKIVNQSWDLKPNRTSTRSGNFR